MNKNGNNIFNIKYFQKVKIFSKRSLFETCKNTDSLNSVQKTVNEELFSQINPAIISIRLFSLCRDNGTRKGNDLALLDISNHEFRTK
jgi:hypothetical protein